MPRKKTEKGAEPDFEITAPLPTRNKKNQLVFEDCPELRLDYYKHATCFII